MDGKQNSRRHGTSDASFFLALALDNLLLQVENQLHRERIPFFQEVFRQFQGGKVVTHLLFGFEEMKVLCFDGGIRLFFCERIALDLRGSERTFLFRIFPQLVGQGKGHLEVAKVCPTFFEGKYSVEHLVGKCDFYHQNFTI